MCTAVAEGTRHPMPGPHRRVGGFQRRPVLYWAMALYSLAAIGLMAARRVGLTSEHGFLVALLVFGVIGRARPFVWDWLPFLFVAVMFAGLTSVSAAVAGSVHAVGPIMLERALLGGAVAATWLQAHVGSGIWAHLLNAAMTSEYLAHFAAPLVMGLWLWRRHRMAFGRFVTAYTVLMGAGFLIYLLYPEMPPWLAAREGRLGPVHRIVVDSLDHLGGFGHLYGGADPEPNAAMPSLHVAVPMLVAATAASISRRPLRAVGWWSLYPLTISFAVVYLGEHYVADAVAGLALGIASFGIVQGLERRTRSARRPKSAPDETAAPARRRSGSPVRLRSGAPEAARPHPLSEMTD